MTTAAERPKILVTVGMGPWPFDRMLEGLAGLSDEYDLFVQTGTSKVDPGCPHQPFIPYHELIQRIASADIVITHAGNTVRLVQRAGGVPIAIAREHARGEMGNDHQVAYLRQEEEHGRVIAVWDVAELPDAVAKHQVESERLLDERALGNRAEPAEVAALLDETVARLMGRADGELRRSTPGWDGSDQESSTRVTVGSNPFGRHPLRRYDFAWRHLAALEGAHLDVGAGFGDFAGPLAISTGRPVSTVDAIAGYSAEVAARFPDLAVDVANADGRLPYDTASFASVSLLDVLEHSCDEQKLLAEAHRVLVDDGVLVVSVPRRHLFTWLDPDNAKFRWPRLHRAIYTRRFGKAAYEHRFVDTSNGFVGDVAVERGEHTNYRTDDLLGLLRRSGFVPETVAGANLFWRWFQIPHLLGGRRIKRACESAIRIDGALFDSPRLTANLFVVARRAS